MKFKERDFLSFVRKTICTQTAKAEDEASLMSDRTMAFVPSFQSTFSIHLSLNSQPPPTKTNQTSFTHIHRHITHIYITLVRELDNYKYYNHSLCVIHEQIVTHTWGGRDDVVSCFFYIKTQYDQQITFWVSVSVFCSWVSEVNYKKQLAHF